MPGNDGNRVTIGRFDFPNAGPAFVGSNMTEIGTGRPDSGAPRSPRTTFLGRRAGKAFISGGRDRIVVAGTRFEDRRMNGGHIGRSLRRLEDPRFLTGRGRYVDDIDLPGQLHAVVLRSPHGHAEIDGI